MSKLHLVYKVWRNNCLCNAGLRMQDCPGLPSEEDIEEIHRWMRDPNAITDIWPFDDVRHFDEYLEMHGVEYNE